MTSDRICSLCAGMDAYRAVIGSRECDQAALDFAYNGLREALVEIGWLQAIIKYCNDNEYECDPYCCQNFLREIRDIAEGKSEQEQEENESCPVES